MNTTRLLLYNQKRFHVRIQKLISLAKHDSRFLERFALISISQLNNFLRSYLMSLYHGAYDSAGNFVQLSSSFNSLNHLIDQTIMFGARRRWKSGNVGQWKEREEPAYHTPFVFVNIINGIQPSNTNVIFAALTDSWKIDVLRNIRNYFAHRCRSTENEAISIVENNYSVRNYRADKILLANDPRIGRSIIDDIAHYLIDFSSNIS